MGLSNSSDIFQQKMTNLFQGFYFIRAYKDDILVFKKVDWGYYVQKLELTFKKVK